MFVHLDLYLHRSCPRKKNSNHSVLSVVRHCYRVRLGKAPDEMSTDGLELDGRGEMGRDTRCALKLLAAGQGVSELWMQNISLWPVRWSAGFSKHRRWGSRAKEPGI
ncbi:hypothetical protein ACQJBY_004597 [Aegilops geniculata]